MWSRSNRGKKFEFLRPFGKANEKISIVCFLKSCFALDQLYIELKTKKIGVNDQQCFAFTLCVQWSPNEAKIQIFTSSCRITNSLSNPQDFIHHTHATITRS
jgi:hypothetical protein